MANHPQGIPKPALPRPSPRRRGEHRRDLLDFAWLLALACAGFGAMLLDMMVGFDAVWRAVFPE